MIASLKSERLKTPNEGSKPEFHLRWIRELVPNALVAIDSSLPELCATRKLSSNLFFWASELTAIRWRPDLAQCRETLGRHIGVNMLSGNKVCTGVTRFLRGN
jgi:hypothetical protein